MRRSPDDRAASNDNRASDVELDQYYTDEVIARYLYGVLLKFIDPTAYLMIEPSAGKGAFFKLMPGGSRAIDKDPKYPGIKTADFLETTFKSSKPICFVGNPPFGRQASMAKKFFNRAASQGQIIAFIMPRSVRKASVEDCLDSSFHLLHEVEVPKDAFLFRGRPYDVPATFQIWVKRTKKRTLRKPGRKHPHFEFLKTAEGADFMLQRVGAKAGRVHHEFERSGKAHYFIRANRIGVRAIMRRLDFGSVTGNVAGKPSLAMSEVVTLYRQWWEEAEAEAAACAQEACR